MEYVTPAVRPPRLMAPSEPPQVVGLELDVEDISGVGGSVSVNGPTGADVQLPPGFTVTLLYVPEPRPVTITCPLALEVTLTVYITLANV